MTPSFRFGLPDFLPSNTRFRNPSTKIAQHWVSVPNLPGVLEKMMSAVVQTEDVRFEAAGRDCTPEVPLVDGLLPLWLWKASQLSEEALGFKFPIDFKENNDALLGVVADFPKTAMPAMWALFLYETLHSYVQEYKKNPLWRPGEAIDLSPLFEEWVQAIENKNIVIKTPAASPVRPTQQGQAARG